MGGDGCRAGHPTAKRGRKPSSGGARCDGQRLPIAQSTSRKMEGITSDPDSGKRYLAMSEAR